jgi:hypothetical protein
MMKNLLYGAGYISAPSVLVGNRHACSLQNLYEEKEMIIVRG